MDSSEKYDKESDHNHSCYSNSRQEELYSIFFLVVIVWSFFVKVAHSTSSDH